MTNLNFREVSINDGYKEFLFLKSRKKENENGFRIKVPKDFNDFRTIIEELIRDKNRKISEERVPQTVYWVEKDREIIGLVKIRLVLSEKLKKKGGNIGYFISDKYRRKGYGKELLKNALKLFKDTENVIITCNKNNMASKKVIEYNNGKLIKIYEDSCIYKITIKNTNDLNEKVQDNFEK